MVKTIQQLQKVQTTNDGSFTSIEGWHTMWLGMPNTTLSVELQNLQESIVSQSKLISIEEIFQDINRRMLETSYTVNLGQKLKMALELKRYLWQKMKLDKPHIVAKLVTQKTIPFVVPKVAIVVMAIDNHMVVIQVWIGKNTIEDVLLDGRSRVNINT